MTRVAIGNMPWHFLRRCAEETWWRLESFSILGCPEFRASSSSIAQPRKTSTRHCELQCDHQLAWSGLKVGSSYGILMLQVQSSDISLFAFVFMHLVIKTYRCLLCCSSCKSKTALRSRCDVMPLSRYGRYGEVLLFSVLSSSQNVLHFGSSEPKRLV